MWRRISLTRWRRPFSALTGNGNGNGQGGSKKNIRPSTKNNNNAYKAPNVRLPTLGHLMGVNEDWGLELEQDEVEDLRACMKDAIKAYQRVEELTNSSNTSSFAPLPKFPRLPGGHRPAPEENPYNAWYCTTEIRAPSPSSSSLSSSPKPLLQGKTVAIKDTISVAGVPMMNGSRILEGYIPEIEAPVVTRVLEAGGLVAGKAVAEDLCCSGSSFATALGPVRNPWHESYAAGGSSSGCGALVGGGVVDMALGTDQGGSIRIPASWCGCVGLKPTFGLVPFTGIASHEYSVDHVGPMARTVKDTALLLEAIAGYDEEGRDARQPYHLTQQASLPKYSSLVTGDVQGMRIGVLLEGLENCEEDVKEHCLQTAENLRKAGAQVENVSIPLHRDSAAIWLPLCLEGGHLTRMEGERNASGYHSPSLQQALFRGFRCQASELSYTNQFYILFGEYLRKTYGNRGYMLAQNLVPALTRAYDALLEGKDKGGQGFDALLLPTLPLKPTLLPEDGMSARECIAKAWCMLQNTAAADLTGHPALSVNAGFSSSSSSSLSPSAAGEQEDQPQLPIGVQVMGRRWDDLRVLNVGMAIEQVRGPTPAPSWRR